MSLSQLNLKQVAGNIHQKQAKCLLINGAAQTRYPHVEKKKINPSPKNCSALTEDLNIRSRTMQQLEENRINMWGISNEQRGFVFDFVKGVVVVVV